MSIPSAPESTGRRSFAKSALAAILALPSLSLAISAQRRKTQPKRSTTVQPTRPRTHDTPPPVTFEDGSFEFQSLEEFTRLQGTNYRYQTATGMPRLAHIKVLDGKGTELHYVRNARGATIRFHLEKMNSSGQLQALDQVTFRGEVMNDESRRVLEITSTMPLNLQNNHKPKGYRKHKGSHPGNGVDKFRMRRIEIVGGSDPFSVDARSPSNARPFNEEFRVMIWFDPE